MHYDIAIKRLMEMGGTGILRAIAGLDLKELHTLDELPQEQTAVLRCDYAAQYTDRQGEEGIVLVEFQTRWEEDKVRDLAAYTIERMRRHALPSRRPFGRCSGVIAGRFISPCRRDSRFG